MPLLLEILAEDKNRSHSSLGWENARSDGESTVRVNMPGTYRFVVSLSLSMWMKIARFRVGNCPHG